jgi:hypothetical protein
MIFNSMINHKAASKIKFTEGIGYSSGRTKYHQPSVLAAMCEMSCLD